MSAAAEIPEVLRLEAVNAGLDEIAIARRWKQYFDWKCKRFGKDADYSLKSWRQHVQWELEEQSDRISPTTWHPSKEQPLLLEVGPRVTFAEWMRMHERAEAVYETPEIGLWAEDVYRWWSSKPEPKPDGWSAIWLYARETASKAPVRT